MPASTSSRRSRRLRKAILAVAAAVSLPLLLPPGGLPASAAVVRQVVVPCRAANPTCWPTAFDVAPDGKVFYVERFTGQIRIFDPSNHTDTLWRTVTGVGTTGEQGLLGLALDPAWPSSGWVYLYYTQASPLANRIIRMLKRSDGTFSVQGLRWIPAASNHNGGVIHFGPDGLLYAVAGDAGDPSHSQDTSSFSGKVLRMTPTGAVPSDNPFANLTWSYGLRNSFGFAWDPMTDRLWETENGPECNDEINRIRKGRNFGWGPNSFCPNTNASGPSPVGPARLYRTTFAPTGAAFCHTCGLGSAFEGTMLFGGWNDGILRRLTFTSDRYGVARTDNVFSNGSGIMAVEAGPTGTIFFSDTNGIYKLAIG